MNPNSVRNARHGALRRALWISSFVLNGIAQAVAASAQLSAPPGYEPVLALMSSDADARARAAKQIKRSKDLGLVPGLVDGLFFAPKAARPEIFDVLETLTALKLERSYYAWVEHVGASAERAPKPGYEDWKRLLFSRIDDTYLRMLDSKLPRRIRLEEIVWGGVNLDGIPSLDQPPMQPASSATYLRDDELIYGIDLGGEQRAYPDRALSWHELTNDTVGGQPVAIVYCTLCGSAIAFSTARADGGVHDLGTSGLLFRSNKLMYDRATLTLWNSMTGKPVLGELAASAIELPILPMTRTRWSEWRRRHPQTKALVLDTQLGSRYGYVYEPGAADRRREGVAFPVWQKSERLARQEEIYGLRVGDSAKAYPLTAVFSERVVNDVVGDVAVVLVADPEAGSVRAYRRGSLRFVPGESADQVVDDQRRNWRLTEDALVLDSTPGASDESSPSDTTEESKLESRLERMPGHVAFWFGWFGFFPRTEVYGTP